MKLAGFDEISANERRELDYLFSVVYEELRHLASASKRNDRRGSLNSTALVHEAWLKMKDSPLLASKTAPHFKAIAAKAMRQVLVDEARKRDAKKRQSNKTLSVTASGFRNKNIACDAELLDLNAALDELERINSTQARMVEIRFFAGLSVSETSELLGVSESTIERDWRSTRAWLASKMRPASE